MFHIPNSYIVAHISSFKVWILQNPSQIIMIKWVMNICTYVIQMKLKITAQNPYTYCGTFPKRLWVHLNKIAWRILLWAPLWVLSGEVKKPRNSDIYELNNESISDGEWFASGNICRSLIRHCFRSLKKERTNTQLGYL